MPNGAGQHNRLDLIVEKESVTTLVDDQDSMPEVQVEVLERDDAHVLYRDAELLQCHVFRDRVILAIAALFQEFERYLPVVFLAPIVDIENIAA